MVRPGRTSFVVGTTATGWRFVVTLGDFSARGMYEWYGWPLDPGLLRSILQSLRPPSPGFLLWYRESPRSEPINLSHSSPSFQRYSFSVLFLWFHSKYFRKMFIGLYVSLSIWWLVWLLYPLSLPRRLVLKLRNPDNQIRNDFVSTLAVTCCWFFKEDGRCYCSNSCRFFDAASDLAGIRSTVDSDCSVTADPNEIPLSSRLLLLCFRS